MECDMRWISVLVVALLLAGCVAEEAPLGTAQVTPAIAGDVFVTRDGVRLPMRHWDADGRPRAVIVALHGMSDYSNAFDGPGREWAKAHITTLAYDQRGFGAGPDRGLWAGGAVMRRDFRDFVAAAHARYPGVPVFALGESMGGAVLLTALTEPDQPPLAGAILVAPAVWSRADMPLSYRVLLFLAAHLTPGLILSNSAARHVVTITPSDNIPMLIALSRDPLFQKKTRVDTLAGLVTLMDEARRAPAKLVAPPPILFLYGKHDQIIPAEPTRAVIAALGSRAEVHRYAHGYHMLLRDLEGPMVDRDIARWILARVPPSKPDPAPSVISPSKGD